ncbi:MAG TPA: hypothetical protein VFS88_08980 [Micavibrio sp.]|nr:hypothetical protein [Micavibrio sp.]
MKTVFDKQAAPASGEAADEEQKSLITDIMEIFSMIMHKLYKLSPNALDYGFKEGEMGYLFSFRHSAAPPINDPSFATDYNREFYCAMRSFLQELRDLEPDVLILPDELEIAAPGLLSLVDTLDLYFKQDNCPLTNADNAATNVATTDPRHIAAALRSMARDGYDLARDRKDAYDYYLISAPRQPFVSLDHYYATIAARVKADVPVSLNLLRRDVLSLEPANDTISADEQKLSLEDSFRDCAEWHEDAPDAPQREDGILLLTKEAQHQFASAIQGMLIVNYGLAQEISAGTIALSVNPIDTNCFHMRFDCPAMPDEKTFGRFVSAFDKFSENIRKAGEIQKCQEGVHMLPVKGNTLMMIRYSPSALFSVITHMAAFQHPGNLQAQAHLRSIAHIKERLQLNVPPNALN